MILSDHPEAKVEIVVVNISEEGLVNQFFEDAISTFGRIDFALNVAGYSHKATSIVDIDEEDYNKSYEINLRGVSGSIEDDR